MVKNKRLDILLTGVWLISFGFLSCQKNSNNLKEINNTYTDKHIKVGETNFYLIPPHGYVIDEQSGFIIENTEIDGENVGINQLKLEGYSNINEYLDEDIDSSQYPNWTNEYYLINKRKVRIRQGLSSDSLTGEIELMGQENNVYFIINVRMDRNIDSWIDDSVRISPVDINALRKSLLSIVLVNDVNLKSLTWLKYDFSTEGTPYQVSYIDKPEVTLTKNGENFYEFNKVILSINQMDLKGDYSKFKDSIFSNVDLIDNSDIENNGIPEWSFKAKSSDPDKNTITMEYEMDFGDFGEIVPSKMCVTYLFNNKFVLAFILWSYSKDYEQDKKYLAKIISGIKSR